MGEVKILPLIIDLTWIFFRSSQDALERARNARPNNKIEESTNLSILSHCRHAEIQASIESIIFSFLIIEATINYIFFNQLRGRQSKGLDKWLQQKWRRNLSIYERFILLMNQYSNDNLDNFQYLTSLFTEFITFRNRIVHAMPEEYQALVESAPNENEAFVHAVDPVKNDEQFSVSKLSDKIGKINYEDAKRGFEIMLLIVCFLDEQFIEELKFPWAGCKNEQKHLRPKDIIASMDFRCYPKICTDSFVPEFVRQWKRKLQDTSADG